MAAQEVLTLNTTTPQIEAPQAGNTYSFPRAVTGALPLGVAGTSLGSFTISGNTSGTITVQPAAAAGTWTFTLPTSAGTANYALTTNGSGVSTWAQISLTAGVTGTLPVANGGTGVTTSTGSGANALATSPTLVTPVLGTPASGNLSNCTADGTDAVGFRNVPQNSKSANYTTVIGDAGKHIFHPAADTNARTFTIDSNANVAYPVGTAITFVNMTANVVTIAITSDTMYLAGAGTTGSRSLAQYGVATAVKITTTSWLISGTGLT